MIEREQLERAIAAQEKLRGALPDGVVDAAIRALRDQLALIGDGEERRRQVTVLFADVSGFTTLSERHDPEEVTRVMNALWSRLDAVILDAGGVIDKHIGDALMAVWGGGASREDDPERALRAALALQEAVAGFRAESRVDLEMRVGVNTGPVLFGSVGTTGEITVIGDAVNVASRLEGVAPLGGVLISHFTYRHIRGVFDVQPQAPMHVKGKRDPLRTYVVRRAKPRAFRIATRGVEGVETQMIGRENEFGNLCSLFEQVQASRESRMIAVLGEAGIGKSRLLYEFENWVELRPESTYLFKGRALSNHATVPYGLYRDVLAARFGILDSDSVAIVAAKLRDGMSPSLRPDEADLVGHWLGFDLGSSAAVRGIAGAAEFATVARAHFVDYLRALAVSETVALLLEDLHWADDESLDLTEYLVEAGISGALMIIAVARPALLERRPEWSTQSPQLHLAALSDAETRALVREVLQRLAEIPETLLELIMQRSDGNAFYVEELVSMLIDEGIIQADGDDTWRADPARLDTARVPATLTAVLQARLDGLATTERHVLQRAAVIGRVFWDAAVAALSAARGDARTSADDVAANLDAAREREFVFQRGSSAFDATKEYIFKHALLRDVTYETVLLRERELLHHEAARWLETTGGARKSEYLEMIADHYERANEVEPAIACLYAAATSARDKGNAAAIRRALDRAQTLASSLDRETPPEVLTMLGEARFRLGDIDGSERALSAVIESSAQPSVVAEALYWMSKVAQAYGDPTSEHAALDRARDLVADDDGPSLAKILNGLAAWEAEYGDSDAARVLAHRALSLKGVSEADKADAYRKLSGIAVVTGDLNLAEEQLQAALDLSSRNGNLELQALTIGLRGFISHLRGDASGREDHYRAAAADYAEALKLARRLGLPGLQSQNTLNLAQVSVRLNEHATAHQHIQDSAAIAAKMGATDHLLYCIIIEADRLASIGDTTNALRLIGLARSHPSVGAMLHQETERIVSRVPLDERAIEASAAAGTDLDLEAAIAAILEGEQK
jgi:class 3 adenylate cyclase